MNHSILKILIVAFFCIACIGCGNGFATVSGEITYNGTPISEGEIRFLPDDKGPSAAAIITDGHYSVEIKPGAKKVQIFANKVVGTKDIGKIIEIKEQYLPAKFNTKTELTCEIGSGSSTQDFALTTP